MARFTIVSIFVTQMFCIHGYAKVHYIPLVFSLLHKKNKKTYTALFRLLNDKCIEHLLELRPNFAIIDFEKAIDNAVIGCGRI